MGIVDVINLVDWTGRKPCEEVVRARRYHMTVKLQFGELESRQAQTTGCVLRPIAFRIWPSRFRQDRDRETARCRLRIHT